MKNIFKILGIAVLACGMMVACTPNDPDPDPEPTPTPGPNPDPQPTTGTIAVVWDGAAQDIQFTAATADNESLNGATVYKIEAAKGLNNNEYVLPAFIQQFLATADDFGHVSEWNITGGDGQAHAGTYFFPCEAYIAGGIEIGDEIVGDWNLYDIDIASESFDATAMTINANLDCVMYDFADYFDQYSNIYAAYQAGEMTQEEASQALQAIELITKNMNFTMTNFKID